MRYFRLIAVALALVHAAPASRVPRAAGQHAEVRHHLCSATLVRVPTEHPHRSIRGAAHGLDQRVTDSMPEGSRSG
jgi:hypothetical protein